MERQKAAALALGVDRARDERERVGGRREREPETVSQRVAGGRRAEQIAEQARAGGGERRGIEAAGNGRIRHTITTMPQSATSPRPFRIMPTLALAIAAPAVLAQAQAP